MKVVEIFGSIDGEGLRTGELATFIRLAGCNLRCSYCDTCYALKNSDGIEMTIDEILEKVKNIGYKNITLTGGEPLIHKDIDELIKTLLENDYMINIETNGSIDISNLDKRILITMDYKTPASNEENKMNLANFNYLKENDVMKFVCNRNDLPKVKEIIKNNNIKSYIYLSPIFNEIEPVELVDFLKELHKENIDTKKIRVQIQLHKIIWSPDERSV